MTRHCVLFTGSRDWSDPEPVLRAINRYPGQSFMIHGDAKGLDRLAARLAHQRGWVVIAIPADWRPGGGELDRSAGPSGTR